MASERTYTINTKKVDQLREEQGMSVEHLAGKADIHVRTLKKWLSGKPAFIKNVKALADALGVSTKDLLEGFEQFPLLPAASSAGATDSPLRVSLALPPEDASNPVLVQHFFNSFQHAMIGYDFAKQFLEKPPNIGIYPATEMHQHFNQYCQFDGRYTVAFVPAANKWGQKAYVFAIYPTQLHAGFIDSIDQHGDIAEFALYIYVGLGEPTKEIKDAVLRYYGWDYDFAANPKHLT